MRQGAIFSMQHSAQPEHLLFIVSAPSGGGKTTLCREVLGKMTGLAFSISNTTRPPRPGEVNGKNYFFVSRQQFQEDLDNNRMAEWTEIYGNCYGTARQTIEDLFAQGCDILFDIDEPGARQLKEAYPSVITVLVLPPSLQVLRQRLIERGTEEGETLERRLERAKEEIAAMRWYDYIIINNTITEAADQLQAVITSERCRHNRSSIEELLS
jgi:guanylate kinase